MRNVLATSVFFYLTFLVPVAYAEDAPNPATPAKPKVYALVAAMGQQFAVVNQIPSINSRLPPYERYVAEFTRDSLNRFALHALDKAIESTDPGSKRIYLSLPVGRTDRAPPSQRSDVALEAVIRSLQLNIFDRSEWDSIVVVTPAFKTSEFNGIASRVAGFGMFKQGLKGNRDAFHAIGTNAGGAMADFGDLNGPEAMTSTGAMVPSELYVASFSYIEIWVLDPKTLAVVDRQQRFDNVKLSLSDPSSEITLDQFFKNFNILVERSVLAAVTHSEIISKTPQVDVGDVKVANPDDEKK